MCYLSVFKKCAFPKISELEQADVFCVLVANLIWYRDRLYVF